MKQKKVSLTGETMVIALQLTSRRNHRWVAAIVSLFAFSGAFRVLVKLKPDSRDQSVITSQFNVTDVALDINQLQAAIGAEKVISNISPVKINGESYWQVFNKRTMTVDAAKQETTGNKPTMHQHHRPPATLYVHAGDYRLLENGEQQYAAYLAGLYSHRSPADIVHATLITKFEGEYGMGNKRLPVWKVSYDDARSERYYVETSSGTLAACKNDTDLAESYSFSLFHKHHFMNFWGKPARDASAMTWTAALLAAVVTGLIVWNKKRKRKIVAPV